MVISFIKVKVINRRKLCNNSVTKVLITTLLILTQVYSTRSQTLTQLVDSIRKEYRIPELGFAVISSDKVYEMQVLGSKKLNSTLTAALEDKFRIGSNTKEITGFIAALNVKESRISWNTKFFDLFPELKSISHQAYRELTLLNLLSFRTKLISYSYYFAEPKIDQFKGSEEEQRYQFLAWFLKQSPDTTTKEVHFSNLGYVAAGLMLEKATGKSYKTLVKDLGVKLGIDFRFGQPNCIDSLKQPWGYDKNLVAEPPMNNIKLNWLLAAGNITVSLPDFSKFIQLQLQGLNGKSQLLTKEEFNFLFSGLAKFSVGWFCDKNATNQTYYYHAGNPGTFLTEVHVFNQHNIAFILFANSQTTATEQGFGVIFNEFEKKYLNQ